MPFPHSSQCYKAKRLDQRTVLFQQRKVSGKNLRSKDGICLVDDSPIYYLYRRCRNHSCGGSEPLGGSRGPMVESNPCSRPFFQVSRPRLRFPNGPVESTARRSPCELVGFLSPCGARRSSRVMEAQPCSRPPVAVPFFNSLYSCSFWRRFVARLLRSNRRSLLLTGRYHPRRRNVFHYQTLCQVQ
jgi:hypothetical protein